MKYILFFTFFFVILSCSDNNNDNNSGDNNKKDEYQINLEADLQGILPSSNLKIALNVLPKWLRTAFFYKIKSIEPLKEEDYPDLNVYPPLNATDPKSFFTDLVLELDKKILDEVIFQVIITPNNILTDFNFRIDLFKENAESIYQIAEDLGYVNIKEGDDFTTLSYKIEDKDGNYYDYELPYYYYYYYVLPLIIDDNGAFYINPQTGKFTEKGGGSRQGKMWRDYLYNHNKESRPSLRELLAGKDVLWRHKSNFWGHYDTQRWMNGYKDSELTLENQVEKVDAFLNEAYANQGALGSVIEWMMKNMIFGAKVKRPIEPAEIFTWGYGNCGEWGDLTTAALRTALIPATVVSTSIDDHVWNEFFDGEWHNVEPYHPFVDYQYYDKDIASEHDDIKGFGWRAHMTSRARPDGLMEDVIDRYSGYGTLKISVKDKNLNPIDDAIILIYGQGDLREEGQLSLGLVTYTDIFGNAEINLGDNRGFWGAVFTPIGSYPVNDDEVYKIMENVETDGEYVWDIIIDAERKVFLPDVKNNDENAELVLSYDLKDFEVYSLGYNIWHGDIFLKKEDSEKRNISVMVLDEENYNKFIDKENTDNVEAVYYSDKIKDEINLSLSFGDLYFVVANKNALRTIYSGDLNLEFKIDNKNYEKYDENIYLFSNGIFAVKFSVEKL